MAQWTWFSVKRLGVERQPARIARSKPRRFPPCGLGRPGQSGFASWLSMLPTGSRFQASSSRPAAQRIAEMSCVGPATRRLQRQAATKGCLILRGHAGNAAPTCFPRNVEIAPRNIGACVRNGPHGRFALTGQAARDWKAVDAWMGCRAHGRFLNLLLLRKDRGQEVEHLAQAHHRGGDGNTAGALFAAAVAGALCHFDEEAAAQAGAAGAGAAAGRAGGEVEAGDGHDGRRVLATIPAR